MPVTSTEAPQCGLLVAAATGEPVVAVPGADTPAEPLTPHAAEAAARLSVRVAHTSKLCRSVLYWSLAVVYVTVAIMACLAIWQLVDRQSENHVVAWAVGAMFVAVAVPLSLHDIAMHLLHYTVPPLQRHAIRIVAMVPIYSVESWLALRFKEQAIYAETLREAYEAYVIWSFAKMLLNYLGNYERIKGRMRAAGKEHVKLFFPFCCCKWGPPSVFLYRTSAGILQYVVVRLITTVATLVMQVKGVYNEGHFSDPKSGYIYIVVLVTVSQGWAMYCLVQLYHTFKADLKPLRPFGKFLVVKSVVFLSFYQQILIAALVFWNVIKPTLEYSQEEVAKGLQDFIIVIEMGFAAVAHHYAFGYADFLRPDLAAELHVDRDAEGRVIAHHHGLGRALKDLIPLDVVKDTGATIVRGFGRMRSQQSGMTLPAAAATAGLVDTARTPVTAAPSAAAAAAAAAGCGPALSAATATVLEMRDSPRHSSSADSAAVAASLASFASAGPSASTAPGAAVASTAAPRTPSARGASSGAGAVAVAVTIANPANPASSSSGASSSSSTPAAASPAAVAVLNPLAAASAAASPAAPLLPGATDAGAGAGSNAAEWR